MYRSCITCMHHVWHVRIMYDASCMTCTHHVWHEWHTMHHVRITYDIDIDTPCMTLVYTLFTNSRPWSVILTVQQPWRLKHRNKNSATPAAVLSGSAVASGHLENKHDTVSKYLFPRGVSGRGPIMSTPIVCHTLSFTGMGWSSAENLSNFLLGCVKYIVYTCCIYMTCDMTTLCKPCH